MTIKDIRAMFVVGQKWTATRTGGKPLVVNGNAGQSVLPANNTTEERTVFKVGSVDLVWSRPGSDRRLYGQWPKASEVLEARPGYLRFAYDNGVTVELTLQTEKPASSVETSKNALAI